MSREAGGHSGLSSIQAEVYKILSKWWVTRTIARKVNKGRDGFILYLSITVRLLDTYKISCVPSKMATLFENKTKRIYKTIYPTVRRKRQNVHHQWRIQDFPWGGGGVDLVLGHWLPRWLRFENFVCQNKRIWTLGGSVIMYAKIII